MGPSDPPTSASHVAGTTGVHPNHIMDVWFITYTVVLFKKKNNLPSISRVESNLGHSLDCTIKIHIILSPINNIATYSICVQQLNFKWNSTLFQQKSAARESCQPPSTPAPVHASRPKAQGMRALFKSSPSLTTHNTQSFPPCCFWMACWSVWTASGRGFRLQFPRVLELNWLFSQHSQGTLCTQ